MGFVIDKQGDYLPVFGEYTGGASEKVHLASGTTFNVKSNGTADFSKLSDAITYINDKWSEGIVTINLDEDNFTETGAIWISSNINRLNIIGKGADKTIITNTSTDPRFIAIGNSKTRITFKDFQLVRSLGDKTTDYRGISIEGLAESIVNNVTFVGCNDAIGATSGTFFLQGTINISNCNYGIRPVAGGAVYGIYGAKFNFNDVNNAYVVNSGGIIALYQPVITYTSVVNKVNQTVGTATNAGWITGVTV